MYVSDSRFQLLMKNFFLNEGLEPALENGIPACVLTCEGAGEVLARESPKGWFTLAMEIGIRPEGAGENWYYDTLTENLQFDRGTPSPTLGIIGNVLIQKSQLPLEYLNVELLTEWLDAFVEAGVSARERLINSRNEQDATQQTPATNTDWLKI